MAISVCRGLKTGQGQLRGWPARPGCLGGKGREDSLEVCAGRWTATLGSWGRVNRMTSIALLSLQMPDSGPYRSLETVVPMCEVPPERWANC